MPAVVSRLTTPDGAVARFDRSYPGDPGSLRSCRRDMAAFLDAHGAGLDLQERAALVVSEFASNALQATPDEEYGVTASLHHPSLSITVWNRDTGGRPTIAGMPHPTSARGRGLAIVESLSESVAVSTVDGRVAVTARMLAGVIPV